MYGKLVDRSGQPAAAVCIVLMQTIERTKIALGSAVSDSIGAFILTFAMPAADPREPEYELQLSVNKKPIPLPDLAGTGSGSGLETHGSKPLAGRTLYGPFTFVVERQPPKDVTGVVPKPLLLASDDEILVAIKRAPGLFTRPAAARQPDPCNPQVPFNVPTRVFYLQQLAMFPTDGTLNMLTQPIKFDFKERGAIMGDLCYGALFEFRQEWWDVGHSLGNLLYSVPLAPCEQTKIATVDWRRKDYAKRQSALDESHFQDTTISRDETVNEAVRLASDKHVTGTTEGGGGGIALGPISGGYGITVQNVDEGIKAPTEASRSINDRIRQTSNTLRNTRAFAIAETTQEEESVVRTRVLRNHNHCHTVTFQYYEVLQHYLIATKINQIRPAVFIPFVPIEFTAEDVASYGYILRRALLDTTLEPVLDRLLGVLQPQALPGLASEGETVVSELSVAMSIGTNPNIDLSKIYLIIDDDVFPLRYESGDRGTRIVAKPLAALPRMTLSQIRKVGFQSVEQGLVRLDDIVVKAKVGIELHEILQEPSIELQPGQRFVKAIQAASQLDMQVSDSLARLISHLNANRTYYTAAIIGGGDAGLRHLILARYGNYNGKILADVVDNTVVGYVGNCIAFPLKSLADIPPNYLGNLTIEEARVLLANPPSESQERLITLPTPGIFAESQMGSCSACEKIDETRFWDWSKSPCPDEAPAITEGMLASRYQDLKTLVDVVKSDLVPKEVQIPEQPEPMIKIGDATMAELVKGLNLQDAGQVLDFVKGLVDTSAEGFKEMLKAIKESKPAADSAPGGGTTDGTGETGDTGATGAEAGQGLEATTGATTPVP